MQKGHSSVTCDWSDEFIKHGGLNHLFDIAVSGVLLGSEAVEWCEWSQDCLASLLKLLCQLGVKSEQADIVGDYVSDAHDTPKKKVRKVRKRASEKLIIPQLSKVSFLIQVTLRYSTFCVLMFF